MACSKQALRRGYADTVRGQLHWRASDPAATDIVLLHWAPGSARMYERVICELESCGFKGLAFDLPGFGGSFRDTAAIDAVSIACCLSEGLATLTDRQVTVLGGHLSGQIAIEWAIHRPDQVGAIVLDGVYALTQVEFTPLVAPYAGLSPRLSSDGSHETFLWRATCAVLKEWNPEFEVNEDSMASIYSAMSDYLAMDYSSILTWMETDKIAPGLGLLDRIRAIQQPILMLTAELEPLRCAFERAISSCRTQPEVHEFPGPHPLFGGSPDAYAQVVSDFIRRLDR